MFRLLSLCWLLGLALLASSAVAVGAGGGLAAAVVPDESGGSVLSEIAPPAFEPLAQSTVEATVAAPVTTALPAAMPAISTTVPVTVTVVPTVTPTITPTLVPTRPGISGLVFHPAHLNAGGKCREVYVARGSLKNHGPALAVSVTISYSIVSGSEWVKRVEVESAEWDELGTDKPARFTVRVYTNEDWPSSDKGTVIKVRLFVDGDDDGSEGGGTETVLRIKGQCKPEKAKPDKPDKPDKPGKPEKLDRVKPEKPGKPEKSGKPDKPEKTKKPKKPGKNK